MKIKEEDPLLDTGSTKEETSPVSHPVMKIQSENAMSSNSETINTTKVKEEVLDIYSSEEERPISDLALEIKKETAIWNGSEVQNKMKIKEEGMVLDNDSNYEETLMVTNNADVYGMVLKTEPEEEPWCQEWTTEVKLLQEASCVSQPKKEANEDFPATRSTRLQAEDTAPSARSATPYLLSTTDLEEEDGFKYEKQNPEFAGASIIEVCKTEMMEASSIEETTCYYEAKTSHDHKQSDELSKCSNGGKNLHASDTSKEKFSQFTLDTQISHEDKRSFKCDVCEKNFTRKGHLKMHILIHQGKRPFKCEFCEKSFTEKRHLKRHVVIHEGKRPFKCEFCEKSFTEKGHLKTHTVIHQDKRPFQCDNCEKSFRQKGDLNRHILIHQGKRPHKCNFCGNSFTLKGNLSKHILIHQDKSSS